MKIGILGQGVSGLFLAALILDKYPNYEVTMIDHNAKPGRKVYVTGNGRCNLANSIIDKYSYNDKFAYNLLKENGYKEEIEFFESIGIKTRFLDNLVYPYSLSAKQFCDYLINHLREKKVKFINEEKIISYELKENKVVLHSKEKLFSYDKLFICCGGKSFKSLGSDGSMFEILRKHGYKIIPTEQGLTSIKTEENTKLVENERLKVKLNLVIDKEEKYEEVGEILFKNDGLSGICVFNASSIISRANSFKKANIYLDLFNDFSEKQLLKMFKNGNKNSKNNFLNGYFNFNVAEYIRVRSGCKNRSNFTDDELESIVKTVKSMKFTWVANYPFDRSEVTVGGLDLKEINDNFESKRERNVYFIGEILNLDGLCGGYNIMLCFSEAKKLVSLL